MMTVDSFINLFPMMVECAKDIDGFHKGLHYWVGSSTISEKFLDPSDRCIFLLNKNPVEDTGKYMKAIDPSQFLYCMEDVLFNNFKPVHVKIGSQVSVKINNLPNFEYGKKYTVVSFESRRMETVEGIYRVLDKTGNTPAFDIVSMFATFDGLEFEPYEPNHIEIMATCIKDLKFILSNGNNHMNSVSYQEGHSYRVAQLRDNSLRVYFNKSNNYMILDPEMFAEYFNAPCKFYKKMISGEENKNENTNTRNNSDVKYAVCIRPCIFGNDHQRIRFNPGEDVAYEIIEMNFVNIFDVDHSMVLCTMPYELFDKSFKINKEE